MPVASIKRKELAKKVLLTSNFIVGLLIGTTVVLMTGLCFGAVSEVLFIHPKDYSPAAAEQLLTTYGLATILCGLWAFAMIKNCIKAWKNKEDREKYTIYRKRELLMQTIYAVMSLISTIHSPIPKYYIETIILATWVIWGYINTFTGILGGKDE